MKPLSALNFDCITSPQPISKEEGLRTATSKSFVCLNNFISNNVDIFYEIIVKAWKGDTQGNLIFKETARNFNPMMAMAGKITIAEVEELVPAGELNPDYIHTPGIFVHRIFQGLHYEKRIEQLTVRKR